MRDIIIIDKPKGLTSHDVVQRVKRIFGAKKAGHTGTLDPLATGVLAVCLNNATKEQDRYMAGDKEYDVTILFGRTTTTFDTEGEVVKVSPVPDDLERRVRELIPEFTGKIRQRPPYFSAVKHKGRPLYKWAREGKLIDLPPRTVEIKKFVIRCHCEPGETIHSTSTNTISARITCSKGTYIRSLCHDLGQRLGCGACMKDLRRLSAGPFKIEDAKSLDDLE